MSVFDVIIASVLIGSGVVAVGLVGFIAWYYRGSYGNGDWDGGWKLK